MRFAQGLRKTFQILYRNDFEQMYAGKHKQAASYVTSNPVWWINEEKLCVEGLHARGSCGPF